MYQGRCVQDSRYNREQNPSLGFKRAKEFRHHTQGFHLMSPASYAQFTFPVSFRYSLPCIFEGQLAKKSLGTLLDLYSSTCGSKGSNGVSGHQP